MRDVTLRNNKGERRWIRMGASWARDQSHAHEKDAEVDAGGRARMDWMRCSTERQWRVVAVEGWWC